MWGLSGLLRAKKLSPRADANTATVVQRVLEGAKAAGAGVQLLQTAGRTISGCTSCYYCREHQVCSVKDDMQAIYDAVAAADAVVQAAEQAGKMLAGPTP